ncbi:MAG: hypothetical protein HY800_07990 [Ignavibacteriales bacterium]|nr:hypothetical protein [Ignavibacteriales bacterium]
MLIPLQREKHFFLAILNRILLPPPTIKAALYDLVEEQNVYSRGKKN